MSLLAMNVQFFRKKFISGTSAQAGLNEKITAYSRCGNVFVEIAFLFLISTICFLFLILPVKAGDLPPELRGSGLPIPRFVSIGAEKAFVRSGPAPRYPIKWVYKKDGLPVEIIQEFDVWRKVRDSDGDEGWINKALLSDKRSVIIRGDAPVDMREGFTDSARVMARLEPGVVARLQKCDTAWCNVSAGGFQGWVERKALWGVYPQEIVQ